MCSSRTCWDCARADVLIGGFTQKNRRLGDQHAAARVARGALTDMRPLAPSGGDALGKMLCGIRDVIRRCDAGRSSADP